MKALVAVHRKPRSPLLTGPLLAGSLTGTTVRTAATFTLAGVAGATAFGGTGHADPAPTPAQVRSEIDRLHQEAGTATENYNGAQEKAEKARKELAGLRDEATRRTEKLNKARNSLGSLATAQYRAGGIDPAVQLALSSDPDSYLERSALADRAHRQQTAALRDVRRQAAEIQRIRKTADTRATELEQRRTELERHKKEITAKLEAARDLLGRLSPAERAAATGDDPRARAGTAGRASRSGGPAPRSGVPAPSARAAQAVAYAYGALGSPYVWGATGPGAFDCSGLTQAAWRSAGVSLPRTTYTQINAGQRVARSELAPGDLVFFYGGLSHVGLYVGNGQMIHAPNPSAPVRLAPIDQMPFAGAARPA